MVIRHFMRLDSPVLTICTSFHSSVLITTVEAHLRPGARLKNGEKVVFWSKKRSKNGKLGARIGYCWTFTYSWVLEL